MIQLHRENFSWSHSAGREGVATRLDAMMEDANVAIVKPGDDDYVLEMIALIQHRAEWVMQTGQAREAVANSKTPESLFLAQKALDDAKTPLLERHLIIKLRLRQLYRNPTIEGVLFAMQRVNSRSKKRIQHASRVRGSAPTKKPSIVAELSGLHNQLDEIYMTLRGYQNAVFPAIPSLVEATQLSRRCRPEDSAEEVERPSKRPCIRTNRTSCSEIVIDFIRTWYALQQRSCSDRERLFTASEVYADFAREHGQQVTVRTFIAAIRSALGCKLVYKQKIGMVNQVRIRVNPLPITLTLDAVPSTTALPQRKPPCCTRCFECARCIRCHCARSCLDGQNSIQPPIPPRDAALTYVEQFGRCCVAPKIK